MIVVEDENGNIVRETMKDNDVLMQYRVMRETLVYLSHLDHDDTEQIMLEKLRLQVRGQGIREGGGERERERESSSSGSFSCSFPSPFLPSFPSSTSSSFPLGRTFPPPPPPLRLLLRSPMIIANAETFALLIRRPSGKPSEHS